MARDRKIRRRTFLAGAAGLPLAPSLFRLQTTQRVKGQVSSQGQPLEGVRVSDGFNVVLTDHKGRFVLEVGPHSGPFVFVTTPRGFWADVFFVPIGEAAGRGRVEFQLAPLRQSDSFRFVFWTDIHLEGGGIRLRKFKATVSETNRLDPAFVWAQGDITLEGNAGKDYLDCCRGLKVPIRNGAGNHEHRVWEPEPKMQFWHMFGPTYYSFDWAGVHCVVLDGNKVISKKRHWTSVIGMLSERELAWLKNDLEAKPPEVPVIAAIHIPLATTYTERRGVSPRQAAPWVIGNAGTVRGLLAAHNTKLVLQGHLHENERLCIDGVEYATCMAVAGSWWRSGPGFERGVDNAPRGYHIVSVEKGKISHRFHSSCESHVDAPGELVQAARPVRPYRRKVFVFNWFDPPCAAEVKGGIDSDTLKPMGVEPAVNPLHGLIMPHHFYFEGETISLSPGAHKFTVRLESQGVSTSCKSPFSVKRSTRVPVIYCTDLFHPHDDPDDHFDAAVLFSLPEVDLRAVILDDTVKQARKPGRVAIDQLCALTGKRVSVATGLSARLKSPGDPATGQPKEHQGGVALILQTLSESQEPVTVITVGSMRDLAAAYNRNPVLCHNKIERIYCFIGDARTVPGSSFREYNVSLDPNAFRRIMTSGLPVYWVPCFDGGPWKNNGHASFWRASHADLLGRVSDPVKQYFIFALTRKKDTDPVAFLKEPVDPEAWQRIHAGKRNLWCCAVFTDAVGRKIVKQGGTWKSVPGTDPAADACPFTFEHVFINVDPKGLVLYPEGLPRYPVSRFKVTNMDDYAACMTAATEDLLARLGRT